MSLVEITLLQVLHSSFVKYSIKLYVWEYVNKQNMIADAGGKHGKSEDRKSVESGAGDAGK